MEKRILGSTGFNTSVIGFGSMSIGKCDEKTAYEVLNTALDNGINYIDTSPEYWRAEEFIGKSVAHRRDEYFLATKCGDSFNPEHPYIFTKEVMMKNLEDSLRLMKTEYIDLWQLHAVLPENLENGQEGEAIECMLNAQKQGKVRFLGASMKNGQKTDERYPARFGYDAMGEFQHWKDLKVFQVVYGAMTRLIEDRISSATKNGKAIVVRGVIKQYQDWYDKAFEESKLSELFEDGEGKQDFFLRFALSHPDICSLIIGTRNCEHLMSNIKAVGKGKLSPEIYNEAKKRLDSVNIRPERA